MAELTTEAATTATSAEEVPGPLSIERKTELLRALLLSSPPGQLLPVANDLRKLLDDDKFLNTLAPLAFREYNTEQITSAKLPNSDRSVLICTEGEVDSSHYLDVKQNQIVKFDHIKQEAVEVREAAAEEGTPEPLVGRRSRLQEALEEYIASSYPQGQVAVYGKKSEDGKLSLLVCISAFVSNTRSFWSGRWRSRWTVDLDDSVSLSGAIKICIHYYEEGNVQLNTSREVERMEGFANGSDDGLAREICDAIRKTEKNFHKDLDQAFAAFSGSTFKVLRRKLPITQTKFEWASSAHSLASELAKNPQQRK